MFPVTIAYTASTWMPMQCKIWQRTGARLAPGGRQARGRGSQKPGSDALSAANRATSAVSSAENMPTYTPLPARTAARRSESQSASALRKRTCSAAQTQRAKRVAAAASCGGMAVLRKLIVHKIDQRESVPNQGGNNEAQAQQKEATSAVTPPAGSAGPAGGWQSIASGSRGPCRQPCTALKQRCHELVADTGPA